MCRKILVVRCIAESSAIIWPLLAAMPKIFESNGMAAIGCASIAFSALLIAGCDSASSSAAATVVRWRITARRISSWRRFI